MEPYAFMKIMHLLLDQLTHLIALRERSFLYFFHQKSVKEISKITCLSIGKIYYRFNRIKSKLGIETTRKLPASLKKIFSQRIGNQYSFVNHA